MQRTAGYVQFAELAQADVPIALSTDTTGSSCNADFFAVMRGVMTAHRLRPDTSMALPARRLLELATIEGARQLGLEAHTGSLTPGKRADLILLRSTDPNMAPVFDAARSVVISGSPANVHTVMVDGRILFAGGKLTAADADEIAREAAASARAIAAKVH